MGRVRQGWVTHPYYSPSPAAFSWIQRVGKPWLTVVDVRALFTDAGDKSKADLGETIKGKPRSQGRPFLSLLPVFHKHFLQVEG